MKQPVNPLTQLPFAAGLDFVKQVWSNVNLPNGAAGPLAESLGKFIAPTLDVKEIDKRVTDLRAVETWLELNLNMLKATVQALEIQRGTITQLSRLGLGKDQPADAATSLPANEIMAKIMGAQQWWGALSQPVTQMMQQAGLSPAAAVKPATKKTSPAKKSAPKKPAAKPRKKTTAKL